jgi:hypothetical protein
VLTVLMALAVAWDDTIDSGSAFRGVQPANSLRSMNVISASRSPVRECEYFWVHPRKGAECDIGILAEY